MTTAALNYILQLLKSAPSKMHSSTMNWSKLLTLNKSVKVQKNVALFINGSRFIMLFSKTRGKHYFTSAEIQIGATSGFNENIGLCMDF